MNDSTPIIDYITLDHTAYIDVNSIKFTFTDLRDNTHTVLGRLNCSATSVAVSEAIRLAVQLCPEGYKVKQHLDGQGRIIKLDWKEKKETTS